RRNRHRVGVVRRDDLQSSSVFPDHPRPDTQPRFCRLFKTAYLVSDHPPPHMRDQNSRADLSDRRTLQPHGAVPADRLVEDGVVPLDLPTALPPPAANIHEIRVLGKTGGEAAHVVAVPRLLDVTHKRHHTLLVHGVRSYSGLGLLVSTGCGGTGSGEPAPPWRERLTRLPHFGSYGFPPAPGAHGYGDPPAPATQNAPPPRAPASLSSFPRRM